MTLVFNLKLLWKKNFYTCS